MAQTKLGADKSLKELVLGSSERAADCWGGTGRISLERVCCWLSIEGKIERKYSLCPIVRSEVSFLRGDLVNHLLTTKSENKNSQMRQTVQQLYSIPFPFFAFASRNHCCWSMSSRPCAISWKSVVELDKSLKKKSCSPFRRTGWTLVRPPCLVPKVETTTCRVTKSVRL